MAAVMVTVVQLLVLYRHTDSGMHDYVHNTITTAVLEDKHIENIWIV